MKLFIHFSKTYKMCKIKHNSKHRYRKYNGQRLESVKAVLLETCHNFNGVQIAVVELKDL